MKKTCGSLTRIGCAILLTWALGQNQLAFAGWQGLINGLGRGWASVNVRSSTLVTNRVTTLNDTALPSAAMAPTIGYKTNAPLPAGASAKTYARIKGLSGGIWQASTSGTNSGDGTDNPELQKRLTINPSDCASLTFESVIDQSQGEFNANGNSGSITVTAKATAGAALWLRGFEYTGLMADVPIDNPDTVENESIEYLKVHGLSKFETLVLGPFEFGGPNGCPLIVPFSLNSSNLEHLVFATDGVALSLPLVIVCPSNIVVGCNQPFSYAPAQYAGCGDIAITYSPAPPAGGVFSAGAFPVGDTTVTVTATDTHGQSTNCTFTVTVTDTTAPVVPDLPTLTGEAFVIVPQPAPTTDNCGGVVTARTSDPLVYTNQGTFTVHWRFDDGHGNTNTANQTVIVDDVTPPVPPTIPDAIGGCGTPVIVTRPTAIDAVVGPVIGNTTSPLVYTNLGTNTIVWTFNDGNGNTSTATQRVIVAGLTFQGFFSPVGTVNNTVNNPVTRTAGASFPLKWDMLCGTTPITGGTPPTVDIQKVITKVPLELGTPSRLTAEFQNDWHINWPTPNATKNDIYKATVNLPDGTKAFIFVIFK